jgi:UDP-glucuronate decarboxylase
MLSFPLQILHIHAIIPSMLILVTGSAGFIGTNLVKTLLDQGHSVLGLDSFISSDPWKAELYKSNPNYEFIRHDITKQFHPVLIQSRLVKKHQKISQIYNLACCASPPRVQTHPLETIHVNTIGLENVLKLTQKHSATLLHTSTSEIYGEPLEHPQKESYHGNVNPLDPRAAYNEGKRLSETLCYVYRQLHGLDIKIVRIFNTYGPYMDISDGRVVSNFITQALLDQDITIYGDGSQTRSFQHIDDLASGLTKTMAIESNFMGPVNLGNPEEFTILELAKLIMEKVPTKSKLTYHPIGEGDISRRKPDISLAKEKLYWQPQIPLSQGLDQTITYFREQLNNSKN